MLKSLQSNKPFLALCWVTYLAAYLCRMNLSSVLYKLGPALHIGTESLGVLGSAFFLAYAVGQLVNGFLGDRIRPVYYLTFAVLATAALNLAIAVSSRYEMVLLYWTLNGFVQSMFWGPLMRVLSQRFDPSGNIRVGSVMSASITTGYILSWSVMGRLLVDSQWQAHFLLPAAAALPVLLAWAALAARERRTALPRQACKPGLPSLIRQVRAQKLWLVAAACVFHGLIKESITLWAPLLLVETLHIDVKSSFWFILIIPAANYGGLLLTSRLARRTPGYVGVLLPALFLVVAVCGVAIYFTGAHSVLSVVWIALISAMLSGANCLLLSVIPLSYGGSNIVSSLVGLFDFSSYLGAAVSSLALSLALTGGGLKPVALIWLAAAIAATACSALFIQKRKEGGTDGTECPQRACAD